MLPPPNWVPNSARWGKRCQRGAGHHTEPSGESLRVGAEATLCGDSVVFVSGAGDESRTRDPGCPEGSTLLGKQMHVLLSLMDAPDALIGPSWQVAVVRSPSLGKARLLT